MHYPGVYIIVLDFHIRLEMKGIVILDGLIFHGKSLINMYTYLNVLVFLFSILDHLRSRQMFDIVFPNEMKRNLWKGSNPLTTEFKGGC